MHLCPHDFDGLLDVTVKTSYLTRWQLWDTTNLLADVTAAFAPTRLVRLLEVRGSPDNIHRTDVHTVEANSCAVLSTRLVHRTIIYSFAKCS